MNVSIYLAIYVPNVPNYGIQGKERGSFCKQHRWCSLPCIECAAADQYQATDARARPYLAGVGMPLSYLDMGDTHNAGSGSRFVVKSNSAVVEDK